MNGTSNIDEVRARIMALESADAFDEQAWQRVCADLRAAGRFCALADAERRMETARGNQAAPRAVKRAQDCYCHTCQRGFHHLGINRHTAMHRDRGEDCRVTYSRGDTYWLRFSRRLAVEHG